MPVPADVDAYIAEQPPELHDRLQALREAIHRGAPGCGEGIKYGMPTITPPGEPTRYLAYFAGWKKHLAMYPIPSAPSALEAELEPYRAAKDALHFRHADPLPTTLIERVAGWLLERRGES